MSTVVPPVPVTPSRGAAKLRAIYAMQPDAPLYHREFLFYTLDRWKREGHITDATDLNALFGFDDTGFHRLGQLGWTHVPFAPVFSEAFIEERGECEVIRDASGRHVLYFKGRRSGFMPEFVDHPVKDWKTWEENCQWRLDPATSARRETLAERMREAREAEMRGLMICQNLIGGYMYLRCLIGPTELLYMFYDEPELIHDCMRAWLRLMDTVVAEHQQHVTLDEIFLGEDICYNNGSLISPEMIREFLLPYYSQLVSNARARQLDRTRPLHVQLDSDGNVEPVIDLYREIGVDFISPCEVASGSDVVRIARRHPDLRMLGGIDKRILATTPAAIDRELERILPFMRRRGGYIPTCDHGVPEEVGFENYCHYRKRMREYGG